MKLNLLYLIFFTFLFSSCGNEIEEIKNPSTGKLMKRYEYFLDDNGQKIKDGFYKEWDALGRLIKDFNYKKDSLDGVCTSFGEDGSSSRITYKMGVLNGPAVDINKFGKTINEINFVDDKVEGKQKYFYSDGALESEVDFKDDKAIGYWKFYKKNGALDYKLLFKNNMATELVGKWKIVNQRESYLEFTKDGYYIQYHPYFEHFGEAVKQSEGKIFFSKHIKLIDFNIGDIMEFKINELKKNKIIIHDIESTNKKTVLVLIRVN